MNIAIVTTWFPAGAGYVSRAYEKVLSQSFNVKIYARGGKKMKDDHSWDLENVTWAPLNEYNDIKIGHFLKWLKINEIDFILFNEQRYWAPVIAAKNAGFTIAAYIDYYTEETIPLHSVFDMVICNTERHKSAFNWHHNCVFVQWGTDIEVFFPRENSTNSKLSFVLSLGWEGGYEGDRKGLAFALRAFKKVSGDCILKVYSQLELTKCLPKWKKLILGDDRIEFIVGTFDPFPFSEGDIYLYPSRLDGIGLSLPEALASGLPAITTDSPPMNEFVKDNYNGRLVKVERFISRSDGYYWPQSIVSEDHLVEIMTWYMGNPEIVKYHGENARKMVIQRFNWIRNTKDLNYLIQESIGRRMSTSIEHELKLLAKKMDKRNYPSLGYRFLSIGRSAIKRSLFSLLIK